MGWEREVVQDPKKKRTLKERRDEYAHARRVANAIEKDFYNHNTDTITTKKRRISYSGY